MDKFFAACAARDVLADRGVALIHKRGTLRTQELARVLQHEAGLIDDALGERCRSGELVSCDVQFPDGSAQKEYRLALAPNINSYRVRPENRQPPTFSDAHQKAEGPQKADGHHHKGDEPMAAKQKLRALLERAPKEGRDITDLVKEAGLAYGTVYCALTTMLEAGEVRVAGKDGPRNRYALADGKPRSEVTTRPRKAGAKKAKPSKPRKASTKAKVRVGRRCRVCGCTNQRACPGGCSWVEADLCSRCAADAPVGFRCGIFNDGSLTLHAKAGEVTLAQAETRALFAYLAKMLPDTELA